MRTYTLNLIPADVLQTLDALESRAIAYEKTAANFSGDYKSENDGEYDFFMPEECRDAEEAREIAQHFRDIITTINAQMDAASE